MLARNKAV